MVRRSYEAGQRILQTAMRLLFVSATQTVFSFAATATLNGKVNWFGPSPSLPKVVWGVQMPPAFVQMAMRWWAVSATQAVCPSAATATPVGPRNWLGPSPKLPKVVWALQAPPTFVQMEMRLLLVSATQTVC